MNENITVESIVSDNPKKIEKPYFLKSELKSQRTIDKSVPAIEHSSTKDSGAGDSENLIKIKLKALNSEFFKLTRHQLEILRENNRLQLRIFKIDMKYSSDFDNLVASLIGKKSASLERKKEDNEKEYSAIEEKLKKIERRIDELCSLLKKDMPTSGDGQS